MLFPRNLTIVFSGYCFGNLSMLIIINYRKIRIILEFTHNKTFNVYLIYGDFYQQKTQN